MIPAALGKKVRDIASQVETFIADKKICFSLFSLCDMLFSYKRVYMLTHSVSLTGCRLCCFQASASGIQGNFSGDLLQSGGLLIVAKGTITTTGLFSEVHLH